MAVSIIVILEFTGINSALNASALDLALNLMRLEDKVGISPYVNDSEEMQNSEGMPVVVLLSEVMFEKEFNQTSPLDRKKLTQIIRMLASHPAPELQLIIDLDLSPAYSEIQDRNKVSCEKNIEIQDSWKSDERELYCALMEMSHGKANLVLTTPVPIATPESYRQKHQWMKDMCQSGVNFGLPYLYEEEGAVMRRTLAKSSISETAYLLSKEANRGEVTCHEICRRVKIVDDYSLEFLWLKSPASGMPKLETINAGYFRVNKIIHAHEISQLIDDWNDYIEKTREHKKIVVFLGGSYGHTDKYMSAGGEQSGVVLHAASFYSAYPENRVKNRFVLLSWSLGIISAIVGGFLMIYIKKLEDTWVMAVVSEIVLPVFGFVYLSCLLALLLRWNIDFSAAMIVESAVLFSSIYPNITGKVSPSGNTECEIFKSNLTAIFFWAIIVIAGSLVLMDLISTYIN